MEWEQRFCPNNYCTTESWLVQRSAIRELWQVTSRLGEASYTVAATDPVCPHCGTTLCAAVELGQRRDEIVIESRAMLEYVQTLR